MNSGSFAASEKRIMPAADPLNPATFGNIAYSLEEARAWVDRMDQHH